jgi:AraC family transcriptional regulator
MEAKSRRAKKSRVLEVASLKEILGDNPYIGSDLPMRQIVALLDQEAKDGVPTGSAYLDHLKSAAEIRIAALRSRLVVATQKWSIQAGVRSVLEEIEFDPIGRHDIDSMARTSGYSRGHFLRSFRQLTGLTPHQYLLQRRLEHALALISTSAQSITTIALRCGFASDSHLSRLFKRTFGVAPSTYRANMRRDRRLTR